jgi:hypothetical protein
MELRRADHRVVVASLTIFALAVHGYHPYAEDGGLYVAGIKRLLDPALYGPNADFVREHLRFSLFAPMVAALARITHLPLEWVLLALYAGCIWATLYAAWMIAARCTTNAVGRLGAVALLACWLTLPIAGTSLMLFDPYLTARGLTTPLVLAAVAWAMDGPRRGLAAAAALIATAAMHPLMAAYGFAAIVVLIAVERGGAKAVAALGAIAMLLAAAVQATAPPESAAYLWVARTRYYWFLSEWHWFERLGLLAPLLLLALFSRRNPVLARAGLSLGFISAAVASVFARIPYATHLVARLQPLRCFQTVYLFMILLLGISLGERLLSGKLWRWAAMLCLLGGTMFFVQRNIYPASTHFEWPGAAPQNSWEQAFLWIRTNTPKDALFAMNPHYIQADGEDAQSFRAIAERNALPDYSKDGGEAAITPSLTDQWVAGQRAQAGIEDENDETRYAKLQPLGVDWVILQAGSVTAWDCPYRNPLVKVCLLRP